MPYSRTSTIHVFAAVTWTAFALPVFADDKPTPQKRAASGVDQRQQDLERDFARRLSGSTFAGHYSTAGQKEGAPPRMERYTIARVSKLKGDLWLFESRIQFGQHDVTVPLALEVKWAGDTPVITLSDFTIPGLGTFTARVLIHGGRYAGTWQHGEAGGHLWGTIVPAQAASGKPTTPQTSPARQPAAPKPTPTR